MTLQVLEMYKNWDSQPIVISPASLFLKYLYLTFLPNKSSCSLEMQGKFISLSLQQSASNFPGRRSLFATPGPIDTVS